MESERPQGAAGLVVDVVEALGEPGVGVLIALENLLPPIPSEVVLPFAGYSAAAGRLDPVLAWVAATAGALVGAWVLYGLGRVVGFEGVHRLAAKRWFVLFGTRDLERGERFFDRHGGKVVLLGRCVPFVRSVVSVPAGCARMPLLRFTLLTLLGSAVWNALFIAAGYRLGAQWERVQAYAAPVGRVVAGLLVAGVVVLAVRRVRRQG